MGNKIIFTRLAQIREYAAQRAGGDKQFKDKTSAEKAWTNMLSQVDYHETYALDCVRKMADTLKTTKNATQAGIYGSVSERIERGFKEKQS